MRGVEIESQVGLSQRHFFCILHFAFLGAQDNPAKATQVLQSEIASEATQSSCETRFGCYMHITERTTKHSRRGSKRTTGVPAANRSENQHLANESSPTAGLYALSHALSAGEYVTSLPWCCISYTNMKLAIFDKLASFLVDTRMLQV